MSGRKTIERKRTAGKVSSKRRDEELAGHELSDVLASERHNDKAVALGRHKDLFDAVAGAGKKAYAEATARQSAAAPAEKVDKPEESKLGFPKDHRGGGAKMTSEASHEAIAHLKVLCASWKSAHDAVQFSQIMKTCLDGNVITPAEFRDSLSLIPTTPSLWASGKANAPALMQEEVVEFISQHIEQLPSKSLCLA